MAEKALWAGLDIGETATSLCIIDDNGTAIDERTLPSDAIALCGGLAPHRERLAVIGAEAGAGTDLVRRLRQQGYPVQIFEARRVRRFLTVRRSKTDTIDARGIADVARLGKGIVSSVHVKSIEFQRLRSLLALRRQMVQQKVKAEGFLNSLLQLYGGRRVCSGATSTLRSKVEAELERLRTQDDSNLHDEVLPLLGLCESLRSYIARLDKQLAAAAQSSSVCRQFLEIPGVGPLVALSFYSLIENPHRFGKTADVGAYLGLTPRLHQSGSMSKQLRITKMGDKRTRTLLVTAATVLLRPNVKRTALKDWGLAVAARSGRHRARIAVARKLATIMLGIWKRDVPFDPFPLTSS